MKKEIKKALAIFDHSWNMADPKKHGIPAMNKIHENSIVWLRWQNERIEQLEQALVKIATKDIALKVDVLKDIARQALGKEKQP